MRRFSCLCSVVLLSANGHLLAHADLITYTGEPFTFLAAGNGIVTATFDFLNPLADGAVLTDVDVVSWSMSANGRTISDSSATFFRAEFTIGPSLRPESWAFVSEALLEGVTTRPETIYSFNGPESIFSKPAGNFNDLFGIDDQSPNVAIANSNLASTNVDNPGTWSAVPEPSAFWCVGLLGLGIAARKNLLRQ